MASTNATNANKDGRGTIAVAPTVSEELPTEPTPGANVVDAYALGWAVGDALTCARYGFFGHLVKMPGPDDPADQWTLLVRKIIFLCEKLDNHLNGVKAHPDLGDVLKTVGSLLLEPPPLPGDAETAVGGKSEKAMKLDTRIPAVLWPIASPLASSYQLGHQMQQMCTTPLAEKSAKVNAPERPTTVPVSVGAHSAEVHRLLIALASKLPANAAHATDNSLRLWSASLQADGKESAEDLLQQGRRWHEVLTGDAVGMDVLNASDYVAAADDMTGRLLETVRLVAVRFKAGLIVALLLIVLAVGLKIGGTVGAAGASAVTITFVILVWTAASSFFGRVAAKGQDELWGTEIDWAIAYRFTILKNPPADSELKRYKATNVAEPIKKHLLRYKRLKKLEDPFDSK